MGCREGSKGEDWCGRKKAGTDYLAQLPKSQKGSGEQKVRRKIEESARESHSNKKGEGEWGEEGGETELNRSRTRSYF